MKVFSTTHRAKLVVARRCLALICTALAAASSALAQSGGNFDLRQNVISGGGGTSTGSGNMRVDGTIGQPAAGTMMSCGTFTQAGDFWQAIQGVPSALPVVQFSSSTYPVPKVDPN